MHFVKTRMRPELLERMRRDMNRSKRGIQAEVEYLVERGLAVVEAEEQILQGKSQIDLSGILGINREAALPLSAREGTQG